MRLQAARATGVRPQNILAGATEGKRILPGAVSRDVTDVLRCSGQTNRLPPHPGPLPIGWGEGESPAVSPRSWRRKSSNGLVLAIAEPTAPPDPLSPSEGERAGVRGQPRDKPTAAMATALSLGGKGLAEGLCWIFHT